MNFIYTKIWEDELLALASLKYATRKEDYKLCDLIDLAENSEDIRSIRALVRSLKNRGLDGIDQTIYGVLSTINYKLYYQSVFEIVSELFEPNSEAAAQLLHWKWRDLTNEELEEVLQLAKNNLDMQTMSQYIDILKEHGYEEDEPYNQFINLFYATIKEDKDE